MTHPDQGRTGVKRVVYAALHSMHGLAAAWRNEAAFRQEAVLAVLLIPASAWIGRSWIEITLLAGSVMLVLIVELLNSALEATVDRISTETHPLSKRAKDIGSAAVLLALLLCTCIWAAVLWQRWGPT
jgi:diacylglycerol kinase (ATP)